MQKPLDLKAFVLPPVFAAMTVVGAYIAIPLPWSPIPIVLQNFFILLAGLVLGGRAAAASAGLYLLLGILGLPVFAGGKGGIAVFAGPTGGYLLAYPLAAFLVGFLASRRDSGAAAEIVPAKAGGLSLLRDLLAALAGVAVVYALGVPWLKLRLGLGWDKAAAAGFLPFIAGDVFKAVAAAAIARSLRTVMKEEGAGDRA